MELKSQNDTISVTLSDEQYKEESDSDTHLVKDRPKFNNKKIYRSYLALVKSSPKTHLDESGDIEVCVTYQPCENKCEPPVNQTEVFVDPYEIHELDVVHSFYDPENDEGLNLLKDTTLPHKTFSDRKLSNDDPTINDNSVSKHSEMESNNLSLKSKSTYNSGCCNKKHNRHKQKRKEKNKDPYTNCSKLNSNFLPILTPCGCNQNLHNKVKMTYQPSQYYHNESYMEQPKKRDLKQFSSNYYESTTKKMELTKFCKKLTQKCTFKKELNDISDCYRTGMNGYKNNSNCNNRSNNVKSNCHKHKKHRQKNQIHSSHTQNTLNINSESQNCMSKHSVIKSIPKNSNKNCNCNHDQNHSFEGERGYSGHSRHYHKHRSNNNSDGASYYGGKGRPQFDMTGKTNSPCCVPCCMPCCQTIQSCNCSSNSDGSYSESSDRSTSTNTRSTTYCDDETDDEQCAPCGCPCRCPQFIRPPPYCLNSTYRLNYFRKCIPQFRRFRECDNIQIPLC